MPGPSSFTICAAVPVMPRGSPVETSLYRSGSDCCLVFTTSRGTATAWLRQQHIPPAAKNFAVAAAPRGAAITAPPIATALGGKSVSAARRQRGSAQKPACAALGAGSLQASSEASAPCLDSVPRSRPSSASPPSLRRTACGPITNSRWVWHAVACQRTPARSSAPPRPPNTTRLNRFVARRGRGGLRDMASATAGAAPWAPTPEAQQCLPAVP
mmetsp:Transcript_63609/g.201038  ORF Transcript_63609/g.201038 Transcript_63609/m.201038 type:complete len:214 (+) Transcript_63609:781-1422(+)